MGRDQLIEQHYKSPQEREADTTREPQSKKDHVYAVSDDQGDLLELYRYTAFGEPEIYSPQTQNKRVGSVIANPVLWNSRRYDEQTNLYYYKNRHYKADIERWLGRDAIEKKGGVNLYGYTVNKLLTLWDVLGLNPPKKTPDASEGKYDEWCKCIDVVLEYQFKQGNNFRKTDPLKTHRLGKDKDEWRFNMTEEGITAIKVTPATDVTAHEPPSEVPNKTSSLRARLVFKTDQLNNDEGEIELKGKGVKAIREYHECRQCNYSMEKSA